MNDRIDLMILLDIESYVSDVDVVRSVFDLLPWRWILFENVHIVILCTHFLLEFLLDISLVCTPLENIFKTRTIFLKHSKMIKKL